MSRPVDYAVLEAAAKKLAVHRVLKDIIRIRPAALPAATPLDSPATNSHRPAGNPTASPCAAPALAGESTLVVHATRDDWRGMLVTALLIDAGMAAAAALSVLARWHP